MSNPKAIISLTVCVVVASILSGCGKSDEVKRYNISGQVVYDGKPVRAGRIDLIPDSVKGNSGPAGYAEIINGAFDTSKNGKGTGGGPHIAVITGYSAIPEPQKSSDDTSGSQVESTLLFRDFKREIDLSKSDTQADFEVPVQRK